MLLEVDNLKTHFFLDEGLLKAVDGVSFTIEKRESVALVGESGCGKTIVALSLIHLAPPPARIVQGQVRFEGTDLLQLNSKQLQAYRGKQIGMVFQEPGAALNPVFTVGSQLREVLEFHLGMIRRESKAEAIRLLGDVGLSDPESHLGFYPHQLSGGMQQRVVVAIAMAAKPKLLIADEPTTALDVTVQAEILDLLVHFRERNQMAMLLISHDLGVVSRMTDRILVMYTGRIVEQAPTIQLFQEARHPYTRGLLQSVPRLGEGKRPLRGIPGSVPDFLRLPEGCTFHPRCPLADADCRKEFPPLLEYEERHKCACFKAEHREKNSS